MIGICVVYLARSADQFALLEASIESIRRVTEGPFRIYGCAPGNSRRALRRIRRRGVVALEAPARVSNVSLEHSILLNALVDRAVEDGCDHVATFDMDSWPVLPGWDRRYAELLDAGTPVAAIVRTELGDNFPFGAFTIFRAGFWTPGRSSFNSLVRGPFRPRSTRLSSRPRETGGGVLAQLADEGARFRRLERSNAWNPHPVLGGLYDNAVFHLGSASRSPRFLTDVETYGLDGSPMRRRLADGVNGAIRDFMQRELMQRHDAFITALAGGRGALRPIETDPARLPRRLPPSPPETRADWTEAGGPPVVVEAPAAPENGRRGVRRLLDGCLRAVARASGG